MKNKLKMISILSILFILYFSIAAFSYAENMVDTIKDSVFRLHVIANSDSQEDQALKLLVRDNIIAYMNSICEDTQDKEEVIKIAREQEYTLKEIALQTIHENGYDYAVSIEIGNFYFPTKYYGDIALPNGFYDALEIKIGDAVGQNWWCVLFPPLCFVDVSSGVVPEESKQLLEDNLTDEEYALVDTNHDTDVQFKFKIVEFFENIKMVATKK